MESQTPPVIVAAAAAAPVDDAKDNDGISSHNVIIPFK
jgi:hypothetical protein